MTEMKYPAKIILFGEYGILLGSQALSIPYPRFSGQLKIICKSTTHLTEAELASNGELKRFFDFLQHEQGKYSFLNLNYFKEELQKGLIFESSIPAGFGLGSSGALTAAIYERYVDDPSPIDQLTLRDRLAALESYFHKISSGIDPLTSFWNQPVLLGKLGTLASTVALTKFFDTYSLFLLDIPSRASTGELVRKFIADCNQPGYRGKMESEYVPLVDRTIASVISVEFMQLDRHLIRYSELQFNYFSGMIPESMFKHMKHGIDSGTFQIKLCGSGGGGQMLAITRSSSQTLEYFDSNRLSYTLVTNPKVLQQIT